MGAHGALEAAGIVAVEEVVVPPRVAAELRVVPLRGEREWGSSLPAPDHLRTEECLLLAVRSLRAEVLPVCSDLRVQLPEDDIGAVSAQDVRGRHRRQLARLIRVSEDDLARLERPVVRVRWRPAAALDRRLADTVLEAERGTPGRELVAVLAPDHRDAVQLLMGAAGLFGDGLEPGEVRREHRYGDMDLGRAEWLLPLLRAALADVSEVRRPRSHPFAELGREAVQRALRYPERLRARDT